MNKKYYFMCGLPRSGNTLLSCILNQNPKIHVSTNSIVSFLTYQLNSVIPQREEYISFPKPNFINKLIHSVFDNYYDDVDRPYIIDRSGSWGNIENLNIIKKYITDDIKIICPVRNIPEVLSSFISLCDKHPNNFVDSRLKYVDNYNRCEFLMKPGSMIDVCINSYKTALNPNYRNYFHFIEYDDLIMRPKDTLESVYKFLGIKTYNHDFESISEYTFNDQLYNDDIYGMPLHSVRSKLEKISIQPNLCLDQSIIDKYSNLEFWKQL